MRNKLPPTLIFSGLIIVAITLLMAWALPSYLNSWIPNFTPKALPPEFDHESQKQIADQEVSRYLNLPINFNARQFEWSGDEKVNDFLAFLSDQPSLSPQNSYAHNFLLYLQGEWQHGRALSNYLDFAGISRIVFRTDLKNNELSELDKMKLQDALSRDTGLTRLDHEGYLGEYQNNYPNELVYANAQTLLVWGGLETIRDLGAIENFVPAKTNLVFANQFLDPAKIDQLTTLADALVITNGLRPEDLVPSFLDQQFFIRPYNYINSPASITTWVKASVYEPLHGEWHKTLRESIQSENWDFDYGQGLVYSIRSGEGEGFFPTVLNLNFDVPDSGDYHLLLRQFVNNRGDLLSYRLDDAERQKINSYNPIDQWQWNSLGTVTLTAGPHQLTLENTEGFDAINLVGVIPKAAYDQAMVKVDDLLSGKDLIYTQDLSIRQILAGVDTNLPIKPGAQLNVLCHSSDCSPYAAVTDQAGKVLSRSETVKNEQQVLTKYPLATTAIPPSFNFLNKDAVSSVDLKIRDPEGIKLNNQGGRAWFEIGASAKSKQFRVLSAPIPVAPTITYAFSLELELENIKNLSVRVHQYGQLDDVGQASPKRTDKISTKISGDRRTIKVVDDIITRSDVNFVVFEFSVQQNTGSDSRWALTDFSLARVKDANSEDYAALAIVPKTFSFSNRQYPLSFEKAGGIDYRVSLKNDRPTLLTVTDSYDNLWQAKCGAGQPLEHVINYGFLNGFLVGEQCPESINIDYAPQYWYRYGIGVSLGAIGVGAIISFLLYRHKKRHDSR